MQQHNFAASDLYEDLKLLQATGERCTLQFRGTNGGIAMTDTTIRDVFEDEGGQFLLGDNGLVLRLHQLVAVNGRPLQPLA